MDERGQIGARRGGDRVFVINPSPDGALVETERSGEAGPPVGTVECGPDTGEQVRGEWRGHEMMRHGVVK